MILVGNKFDLDVKRNVTYDEAKLFADKNNLHYIESSAKDYASCELVFQTISNIIYNSLKDISKEELYKINGLKLFDSEEESAGLISNDEHTCCTIL